MNNVTEGCAMLFGRMLQESIDRALGANAILLPGAESPESIVATMQKEAELACDEFNPDDDSFETIDAVCLTSPPMDGFGGSQKFIEDVARRLYGTPLLSFVRHEDRFYFAFRVTNIQTALRVIEAEVKRVGFLELAHISHYDWEDEVCRSYHPKEPAPALALHCAEVLHDAGLLPGN